MGWRNQGWTQHVSGNNPAPPPPQLGTGGTPVSPVSPAVPPVPAHPWQLGHPAQYPAQTGAGGGRAPVGIKSTWGPPSNFDLFHHKGVILTPRPSFPMVGSPEGSRLEEDSPSLPDNAGGKPQTPQAMTSIALASLARKTHSARAWRLLAPEW